VRHGESIWNVTDASRGLITRFTGWADVNLTDIGEEQARAAGTCLKKFGIKPSAVYTSLLKRSIDTYNIMKSAPGPDVFSGSTVIKSWRVNERHYGALMGLSKSEAELKMGYENVMEWRRSWSATPPKMNREDRSEFNAVLWAQPMTIISEPGRQNVIATEKGITVPETESLEDCFQRVLPIWNQGIIPRVLKGETVLVVAHANTIRALVKHVEGESVSLKNFRDIHIPSAIPLLYTFDDVYIEGSNSSDISVIDTLPNDFGLKHMSTSYSKMGPRRPVLVPSGKPSLFGMRGKYVLSKELLSLHFHKKNFTKELANSESSMNTKKAFLALAEKSFEVYFW